MRAEDWSAGRRNAGLTQVQAAKALGVSQPYLSQLENGSRSADAALVGKAAELYRLGPSVLPLRKPDETQALGPEVLEKELAGLGYPRFAHVSSAQKRNPAEVVFGAVVQRDLDTRLIEALPWVMSTYTDLDWPWLRDNAKLRNAQNRLGYIVCLAKELAGLKATDTLAAWEQELEDARLAREDTLCRESMSEAERRWLKAHRPPPAEHWNLLTSLTVEQLPYAAS